MDLDGNESQDPIQQIIAYFNLSNKQFSLSKRSKRILFDFKYLESTISINLREKKLRPLKTKGRNLLYTINNFNGL
jgi:hypothetical protein